MVKWALVVGVFHLYSLCFYPPLQFAWKEVTLNFFCGYCFTWVLVTFATKICSSFSAKRRPMHIRRPYPNGKLTNGWIRCPACGQFDTSPTEYFIRFAITQFCSTAKLSSAPVLAACRAHIPSSPRLIHRSGKNRCGSGKYSSEFDTAKCGKMTCVCVVYDGRIKEKIENGGGVSNEHWISTNWTNAISCYSMHGICSKNMVI